MTPRGVSVSRSRRRSSLASHLEEKNFRMQDQALDNELEDGDEDVSFFTDIDELQAHGINAADIKKLKMAGICTVKGVQMTTRRKMCNIKGISEAKVDKIKEV